MTLCRTQTQRLIRCVVQGQIRYRTDGGASTTSSGTVATTYTQSSTHGGTSAITFTVES
jgi:hypothetical protein